MAPTIYDKQRYEEAAKTDFDTAAHFWVDDAWKFDVTTDLDNCCDDYWYGEVIMTPVLAQYDKSPQHFIVRAKTSEHPEFYFEYGEDAWTELTSQDLFLYLYLELLSKINVLNNKLEKAEYEAEVSKMVRHLCGYIQAGEGQELRISQDEVAKTWHLQAGLQRYWGDTFREAICKAAEEQGY